MKSATTVEKYSDLILENNQLPTLMQVPKRKLLIEITLPSQTDQGFNSIFYKDFVNCRQANSESMLSQQFALNARGLSKLTP